MSSDLSAIRHLPVFRAEDMRVTVGANMGDALLVPQDAVADDVYVLDPDARALRLAFGTDRTGALQVAPASGTGRPGAALDLGAVATFMTPSGQTAEIVIVTERAPDGHVAATYLLPVVPLAPRTGYSLIGIARTGARAIFARIACVSFTRGTRITTATGAQVPIETLRVGERVLTRDSGAQPIRWIGQHTVRAEGAFAPVRIRKGVLNNAADLLVSPDHRLFVYQRQDRLGVGQSEILVKARHLVNGESVTVESGGFVDYFQILLDRHHILYAEGIAAESLLVDPATRPALNAAEADGVSHDDGTRHGHEIGRAILERPDALEILRRASTG